ncbi:hypothetical protein GIB67_036321 [Kingdonia uniflora]|uniref:DNA ligase ATP-dependent N-terminal domain-containing protein n=1 Tax=Kingdonia uniflora TaxID=39325 RepID=A0A7J7L405_9MAGN|nr:hypothetical protein GIB67_036321 [Kingdonia uniflora]
MEESDSNKGTPIKKISDKRSTPSPSKKGSNKKARPSLGINQPTITKFFAKLGTSSSSIGDVSSSLGISELYKEELDKFIQVINGEISRNDASALLEKAKGDVSVAVDMYYGNSGAGIGDGEVGLVLCSKPSQTQVFKETVKIPRLFVQGRQTSHADATYLALPLEKYDPVEHACWSAGQSAPYLHLARAFDLLEGERGKIKATGILCNMFRSVLTLSPEDVLPAVYLCTNNIAADHENMELNVGASLVTAALEKACGMRRSKIKELYNNLGDFGDVAQVCRQTQSLLVPPSTLLLREVLCTLQKISTETGNGSTTRKKQLIVDLMLSCREKEMKFFVRTLAETSAIGGSIGQK